MTTDHSAISRSRLTALAALLVLATALVLTPRPDTARAADPNDAPATAAAATDSLWAAGTDTSLSNSSAVGACASPSATQSQESCFSPASVRSWNQGQSGPSRINAMATDGQRVFIAGEGSLALSCPVTQLGSDCATIGGGAGRPIGGSDILSLAAGDGYLWLGRKDGTIYRCSATVSDSTECKLLDDAGNREVSSLLWANGRLYAGLASYGVEEKKQGLLWTCDPTSANSCATLDTYGNTTANTLAVGGGYLWAGLDNGIIWRCDPVKTNACDNWADSAGYPVASISYNGRDTMYAALGTLGSVKDESGWVWACPLTSRDSCATVRYGGPILTSGFKSVAAGRCSLIGCDIFFSDDLSSAERTAIHSKEWPSGPREGPFTAARISSPILLYLAADGPTGVGSVKVKATGIHRVRDLCTRGQRQPLRLKAVGALGVAARRVVDLCRHGDDKPTLNVTLSELLDPGRYEVTARTAGLNARRSITVTKNAASRVTVRVTAAARG